MSADLSTAAHRLDEAPARASDDGPHSTVEDASVWRALATVIDPEIGLDIVTLGLIYGMAVDATTVQVTFSLTTRGCPMEAVITDGIARAVSSVPGVERVIPLLTWDPIWHPTMIREGAW